MVLKLKLRVMAVCLAALACNDASSQTLCGVTRVAIQEDGFGIAFNGMKDTAILAIADNKETTLELKAGILAPAGKKDAPGPVVKKGAKLYYAAGMGKSCVLHAREQDGKQGLYIEEHTHVHGQPPQLHTEFVEAY
jgi:hypothetical protein